MSHAVHKVTHAISHFAKEVIHHPIESLAVVGGSLLIPGNPLGAVLGIGNSATTGAAGLTALGSMPDTALGAASVASATATTAGIGSVLATASKYAPLLSAGASVAGTLSKPKIDIPNQASVVQPKPKPKSQYMPGYSSLLGSGKGLFGLTKTKYGGSFGSNVAIDLGDKFSLL